MACVLVPFPEEENQQDTYQYTEEVTYDSVGSHGRRGWDAPRLMRASWRLRTPVVKFRLRACIGPAGSSEVQEPGGLAEGRRGGMRQLKQRSCSPSAFLFYLGAQPGLVRRCPPTLGRATCFTLSIESNLIPSRNTLTDTLKDNVMPAFWGTLSSVKVTHKMNFQGRSAPLSFTTQTGGLLLSPRGWVRASAVLPLSPPAPLHYRIALWVLPWVQTKSACTTDMFLVPLLVSDIVDSQVLSGQENPGLSACDFPKVT